MLVTNDQVTAFQRKILLCVRLDQPFYRQGGGCEAEGAGDMGDAAVTVGATQSA